MCKRTHLFIVRCRNTFSWSETRSKQRAQKLRAVKLLKTDQSYLANCII